MTIESTAASQATFANWSKPQGVGCPRTRPRSARLVAEVDHFSESPMNERTSAYWLSTNRERSHWFLWTGYYDDELGEGWVYQVYAYMPRSGIDARRAAMALLLCGWRAERKRRRLTAPPESVVREGLLTQQDIEAISALVWPEHDEV